MIKFLKIRVIKGGSLNYQETLVQKAFNDLENQLNAENVKEILNFSFHETDSDVILVAIVRIEVLSESKPKKAGK